MTERNPLLIPPRERLFAELGARIGWDAVEELHLFAPLRQGGTESGVAVVAARRPVTDDAPATTKLAVFTARYRLTLKGQERGKWEFELRDEADAPLDTIVAVVRGVQERAGDTEEPERIAGAAFRGPDADTSELVT